MEWIKELWPEWEIEQEIGEGAFGNVYKIKRQDIGGTYYAALKVISFPHNKYELERMRERDMTNDQISEYYHRKAVSVSKEFAVMERLKGHTNIVSYEDHKIISRKNCPGWDILIRMELLTSLPKYLKTHNMSESDVCKLGIDICNALMVCEKEKIVHRDVKPENIFVSDFGDYKLGDFSLVKHMEFSLNTSSPKGTYTYIAPEIYKGIEYDYSIDIYSLGLILYRLLNRGRGPFQPLPPDKVTVEDAETANYKRLNSISFPRPVDASPMLASIILKACAYQPEERYKNAADLQESLLKYISHNPVMDVKKQISFYLKKAVKMFQSSYSDLKKSDKESVYPMDKDIFQDDEIAYESEKNIKKCNSSDRKEKRTMDDFFSSAGDL